MDIHFVPKTTLPSSSQPSAQPVSGNQAAVKSANKPILAEPARAVTASADIESPEAERRRDRIAKQGEETVSPRKILDGLLLTSRRTQLDFDRELDRVVLQVVDRRTDEVIETIPSEELLRQLRELVGRNSPPSLDDTGGGAVFDRSI